MTEKVTNDGKKGGNLVGKPHNNKKGESVGGIKAVVTDTGQQVELEGGEVIINKAASKKHWKELSKINQSAGNGVAIGPPIDPHEADPDEYKKGGKIQFNANKLPNKWVVQYAKKIKKEYPEIWKKGGNIFGNEAFNNLLRVSERGYWLDSEKWMYIKWRAFVARHKKDFRIAGVVAMLKWCDKVEKGWSYMKDLIEAEIKKKDKKGWKTSKSERMSKGGSTKAKIKGKAYDTELDDADLTPSVEIAGYDEHWDDYIPTKQQAKKTAEMIAHDKSSLNLHDIKYRVKQEDANLPYILITKIDGELPTVKKLQEKLDVKRFKHFEHGGSTKPNTILDADELKQFTEWIEDGNAFEKEKGVWVEQTTQYRKKFTKNELQKFFKREFFEHGGSTMKKGGVITYRDKYNKKYGFKKGTSHSLKDISKKTGIGMKGIQEIYNKGIGAYKTNPGSVRPSVKSKEQWAYGRVYSAVMGGKAADVDAKELKMNTGGEVYIDESVANNPMSNPQVGMGVIMSEDVGSPFPMVYYVLNINKNTDGSISTLRVGFKDNSYSFGIDFQDFMTGYVPATEKQGKFDKRFFEDGGIIEQKKLEIAELKEYLKKATDKEDIEQTKLSIEELENELMYNYDNGGQIDGSDKGKRYNVYFKDTTSALGLTTNYRYEEEDDVLNRKKAIKQGKRYLSKYHSGKDIPQKYFEFVDIVEVDDNGNEFEQGGEIGDVVYFKSGRNKDKISSGEIYRTFDDEYAVMSGFSQELINKSDVVEPPKTNTKKFLGLFEKGGEIKDSNFDYHIETIKKAEDYLSLNGMESVGEIEKSVDNYLKDREIRPDDEKLITSLEFFKDRLGEKPNPKLTKLGKYLLKNKLAESKEQTYAKGGKMKFKKGDKVSYYNDMSGEQKVGFVLKKMGKQYLIGETPNIDTNRAERAFDTTQGNMSLVTESHYFDKGGYIVEYLDPRNGMQKIDFEDKTSAISFMKNHNSKMESNDFADDEHYAGLYSEDNGNSKLIISSYDSRRNRYDKGGIIIPFENIVEITRPRRSRKISGDLENLPKLPKIVYYLKGKTKDEDFDNDEVYSAEFVEEIKDKGVRVMRDQDFDKGGSIEINEDGSNIPKELQEIFDDYNEDADPYQEAERLRVLANEIGYTFDYDLSGAPTEFQKLETGGKVEQEEQPTHRIKTNVYYVNNYEFDGFQQEAVPEYEISNVEDMLESDEGNHEYIDEGTEGWFDGEMFETVEGSNTRVEPKYVEHILGNGGKMSNKNKSKKIDLKEVARYYGLSWPEFYSKSDKSRKEIVERYKNQLEQNNKMKSGGKMSEKSKTKFYKTYYENVSPTYFKVETEDDKIVIDNINKTYPENFGPKDVKQYSVKQSMEEGGKTPEVKYECYVEYLDKDNGFKRTKMQFKSYRNAEKWCRENFEKFHPDMIGYNFKKGGKVYSPDGRKILYKDNNVALQHNEVSDDYSLIDTKTGLFMDKGGYVPVSIQESKDIVMCLKKCGERELYDWEGIWNPGDNYPTKIKPVSKRSTQIIKEQLYGN